MSARRHLWADHASLVHLETACLQLRKICESIAYLCVVAAEVEFEDFIGPRKNYRVGQVLSDLRKAEKLLFPAFARLIKKTDTANGKGVWRLNIEKAREEDIERVKSTYDATGQILHEFSPFMDFPDSGSASEILWKDLNAVRADHQWLWNRFWQHANRFKGMLFVVNLDDQTQASRPIIIKVEGFLDEEPFIDFDPDYVADFRGVIDWKDYD